MEACKKKSKKVKRFQVCAQGGGKTVKVKVGKKAKTIRLNGLTASTSYTIKVRVQYKGGKWSKWSKKVKVKTSANEHAGLPASADVPSGNGSSKDEPLDTAPYHVRYYVNGQLFKSLGYEEGDDYTVADAPSADGVEFVGWYCNRDGLTDYYDGAVYSGGDARENITCDTNYCGYTRPAAEYHQVHLYLDGREYYSTQTELREAGLLDLTEGSTYTLPTIEAGEHWSIDGWHRVYPDADGNVAVRDTSAEATAMGSARTMGDSDEYWVAERDWDDMTIRFVVDGVERPDLAITAKRGYTVDLPTWDPGAGYSFDGWYDDEAMTSRPADYDDYGGTAAYFADDAVLYGRTFPSTSVFAS